VEYSEDENYEVEVSDEDEEVVPIVSKPVKNIDIVQGSVYEFQDSKKDPAQ
jgi:hypothetical protein